MILKVLAINGSPKMGKGNTATILGPFLEGMREAGATVDLFYTRMLDIKPCSGDLSCWFVHPGQCAVQDDMQKIYPIFREADVIVYATPLYYAGVTGPMKNLMDRTLPLHAFTVTGEAKLQKVVLVSTCGAYDIDAFDPMLGQFKAVFGGDMPSKTVFAGALLRPHADTMGEMIKDDSSRPKVDDVMQAAREAGKSLVQEGRMSSEVLERVSRALLTLGEFEKAALEWMEEMKKGRQA